MPDNTNVEKAHWGLILGFAVMLLLMLALSASALRSNSTLQQSVEQVVDQQRVKTALVTAMRDAARERTVLLTTMLLTDDPFAREEAWLAFDAEGARFLEARETLRTMRLSATEHAILEAQAGRMLASGSVHRRIGELILAGDSVQARHLLLDEAVPLQAYMFDNLNELAVLQEQEASRAATEAEAAYRRARNVTIALGSGALLLGALIGGMVIRRSRRAELRLFREKERAQVTLQTLTEGVITTDDHGRVTYLNSAAEALTGRSAQTARGQSLGNVFVLAEAGPRTELVQRVVHAATPHSDNRALLRQANGTTLAIEYTASPLRDRNHRVLGMVLVLRNVTEVRSLTEQLSYQASHDTLTQLFNRREFERRLQLALDSARTEGRVHAVCYLDLDQFKVVNDTCGHVAGDELLKQLAVALALQVKSRDVLARLGGDEFGVLLEECSPERALEVSQAMQRAVTDFRFVWEQRVFQIGVSIGVVSVAADSGSLTDVLKAADSACYVAKEKGRNRIHVYQVDDTALARRRGEMEWLQRINEALREDRFCLYAQDIMPLSARDDLPPHREVLVRMIDDQGEPVPPQDFVPAAERYNLMPAIDRWVIQNALDLIAQIEAPKGGAFAINLSGQSLCDDGLQEFIIHAFLSSGVEPHRVCFEITETAAITNLSRAAQLIRTLRGMGCQFALDDFGCGLSSFTYLKNLPVDYLKIDGTFVRNMANDPMDRVLVEYINEIGHVLGFKTIAEYVDDDAILILLKHMGVDYAQGYGIARPAPLTPACAKRAAATREREAPPTRTSRRLG
ncbi:EAL domain-containing protein [Ectothiorhodospiraceae bacterium 2226]|nr:EAL domain-containing protein [Ectothiorhodospiraceae bacterium 2226]